MNFEFSHEQKLLKKSFQDFLQKECPTDFVRKMAETQEGYSPEMWRKIVDLGWTGLVFPEQYGGSGYSFFELIILLEEMGYALYPGPFFATVLMGGWAIQSFGTASQKEEYLPGIVDGKSLFSMAVFEAGRRGIEESSIKMSAAKDGDDYVIEGAKLFVPDGNIADYILCVARTTENRRNSNNHKTVFIVDTSDAGVKTRALPCLSWRKLSEVVFNNVRVPSANILGEAGNGWGIVEEMIKVAALGRAAELVGVAQAAYDMAVKHAKSRVQFGRPIGSFQAIQHYVADMWIAIESARMMCYRAASSVSLGLPAPKRAAMAKIKAGEAARMVTARGHQIMGALGFSMECDMHLYYRRAIADDMAFGDQAAQQEKVAVALGL